MNELQKDIDWDLRCRHWNRLGHRVWFLTNGDEKLGLLLNRVSRRFSERHLCKTYMRQGDA